MYTFLRVIVRLKLYAYLKIRLSFFRTLSNLKNTDYKEWNVNIRDVDAFK